MYLIIMYMLESSFKINKISFKDCVWEKIYCFIAILSLLERCNVTLVHP